MVKVRRSIRCPVCSTETQTLMLASLEIDRCAACGGLWLDRGELKQLREMASDAALRKAATELLGEPRVAVIARPKELLACPVCALKMTRRTHEEVSALVIDRCQEHGTWLDQGEATRLLELVAHKDEARAREYAEKRGLKRESLFSLIQKLFD